MRLIAGVSASLRSLSLFIFFTLGGVDCQMKILDGHGLNGEPMCRLYNGIQVNKGNVGTVIVSIEEPLLGHDAVAPTRRLCTPRSLLICFSGGVGSRGHRL